jgi:hypothetical protein
MLIHGLRLGLVWLALCLVTPTLALSEFACLQILQRFANQFLAPTQIDNARCVYAVLGAEHVVFSTLVDGHAGLCSRVMWSARLMVSRGPLSLVSL